jgi:hypothetical protein
MILLVLCECETRFIAAWKEDRFRVFENKLLRGISGPRKEEVTGG